MDTTTQTTDETLDLTKTAETIETTAEEKPKTDVPKLLREQLKKQSDYSKKLEAELNAIKKAEEDKTKSAEEKLAEKDLKIKEFEEKLTRNETIFSLEKKLLTEKINPEFSDLILSKAQELVTSETSIDEVVEMLKTNYPTAFTVDETPKPLGKVGLSASTGNTSLAMTKEQVIKDLQDPRKPLTKELSEMAKYYGL